MFTGCTARPELVTELYLSATHSGQVRSCTKSLVIDMGFVLEGTEVWELPECLLGAMRMHRLDLAGLKTLDMSQELPLT